MGSKTGHLVVEVDDRGRITIPKRVREKLGILSGDELELDVENSNIVIESRHKSPVTATAQKNEWRGDAFHDAGEALFGDYEE